MRDLRGMTGWFAVVVLLAVLGLTGCGGDDADSASDPLDPVPADDADNADADADADTAGDDFPIPAPDGLLLDAHADAGVPQSNQRHLYYADGDFDRVVAFYDDWTAEGGDWMKTEAGGTVSFRLVDDEGLQQIVVTPGFDPGAQADGPVTSVALVFG